MTDSVPKSSRQIWTRRILRAVLLYLLIPWCAILLLLLFFQRSLMYVPRQGQVSRDLIPGFAPGQIQEVTLESDFGNLNGWHFLPEGETAETNQESDSLLKQAPWVVIVFSGNAGNREGHAPGNRDFTALGCHVFAFDYRGYGDNPGSPSQSGMQEDADAVWNYVTKVRKVPPEKLLIFGESLGGAVAVYLASRLSQEGTPPAGLILSCTFSSMGDAGSYHYPYFPVRWVLWDRWDSVDSIQHLTCPFLQFHAEEDEIVPLALGRKLFQAAPEQSRTGIEKRFILLKGVGHNTIPAGMLQSELKSWFATIRPE